TEYSQRPAQAKTQFAPKARRSRGSCGKISPGLLKGSFDPRKELAGKIILRKWQQVFHCRITIDLNQTVSEFRLPFPKNVVQTQPHALARDFASLIGFTESVNHCAFESCRQIRRRLRGF